MNDFLHRLTTSRYTRVLEAEVDRLREENRSLLNSLLTRAGVSPIDPPKMVPRTGNRMSRFQRQAQIEREWLKGVSTPEQKGN